MSKSKKPRKGPKRKRQIKQWNPIFFTKRPFEDRPFFEARESIAGFEREGGPLAAFFEDVESSIPSWEMTVIKHFLQTYETWVKPASNVARARLDDREHGSGRCRQDLGWLTPMELQRALETQVLPEIITMA
jgi:hypothetical protein